MHEVENSKDAKGYSDVSRPVLQCACDTSSFCIPADAVPAHKFQTQPFTRTNTNEHDIVYTVISSIYQRLGGQSTPHLQSCHTRLLPDSWVVPNPLPAHTVRS